MAEPILKLDPTGQAPILSYNVPQPTSISGRHYVGLDINGMDDTWFKPVPNVPAQPDPAQPVIRPMQPAIADLLAAGEAMGTDKIANILVPAHYTQVGAVSSALASLTVADLKQMKTTGRRPVFYRSFTGNLTYQIANDPRPGNGSGPPPPYGGPAIPEVDIMAPGQGSTVVDPAGGVHVTISGVVSFSSGGRLEVILGMSHKSWSV